MSKPLLTDDVIEQASVGNRFREHPIMTGDQEFYDETGQLSAPSLLTRAVGLRMLNAINSKHKLNRILFF